MAEVRIEVTCPGCQKPFLVPVSEQGHVADCPHCQGWVDVPEVGRPPSTAELDEAASARHKTEYDRQLGEGDRQLREGARQLEQAQRALDLRDRQDAQFSELLNRVSAVIGRWEQLAERMAHVIEQMGRGGRA
jgi:hypothetical protein